MSSSICFCISLGVTLLIVLVCGVVGQALSPLYVLSMDDQAKLKAVFEQAQPFTDLANAHYSILGLKLFSATIPKAQVSIKYLNFTLTRCPKKSTCSTYRSTMYSGVPKIGM